MPEDGLTSFESSLEAMLGKLGIPDPALMAQLTSEWDELAGEPWQGRSRPVLVQRKTLVVEANAPSMIAYLKYGKTTLLARLAERFGEGVVERVEIRLPAR
jgi:predicted nucleic acid-binding Zn ribbon protein